MPYIPEGKRPPWMGEKPKTQQKRRPTHKFYHSKGWRTVRKRKLSMNPLCEECDRHGRTTEATMVDHIKPVNPDNPWDTENGKWGHPLKDENLQSMCDHCHAVKRGKERHQQ